MTQGFTNQLPIPLPVNLGGSGTETATGSGDLVLNDAPTILGMVGGIAPIAGQVGEVLFNNQPYASALPFTSTVIRDILTLNLTAGNWLVFGNAYCISGGNVNYFQCWLNTVSATIPDRSKISYLNQPAGLNCPILHINTAAPITIYLSGSATFPTTSASGCGNILALRIN